MKLFSITLTISFLLFTGFMTEAQNNRIKNSNQIGWYNVFTTVKLSPKFGIHAEYQWRRTHIISAWQQSLLRVGINYTINPKVLCRIGYAWIETYPYGDYPINGQGKSFTEHRIYEMVQLSHKENIFEISHRFMLEQRFVGKYSQANLKKEDQYPLLNRIRYMCRVQVPLIHKEMTNKTPYIAFYDEIMIGFGKNVNANVFDQNRFAFLLGYRFNPIFRIEAGYLNQVVQLGRQVNNKNIFQYNNGIIINTYINMDVSKKNKSN